MRPILFPGYNRQACLAKFDVQIDRTSPLPIANIVLIQDQCDGGLILLGNDEALSQLLNRILIQEFGGIRIDLTQFSVLFRDANSTSGFRYSIEIDVDQYIEDGHPWRSVGTEGIGTSLRRLAGIGPESPQPIEVDPYDITGEKGCYFVSESTRVVLSEEEISSILSKLN